MYNSKKRVEKENKKPPRITSALWLKSVTRWWRSRAGSERFGPLIIKPMVGVFAFCSSLCTTQHVQWGDEPLARRGMFFWSWSREWWRGTNCQRKSVQLQQVAVNAHRNIRAVPIHCIALHAAIAKITCIFSLFLFMTLPIQQINSSFCSVTKIKISRQDGIPVMWRK